MTHSIMVQGIFSAMVLGIALYDAIMLRIPHFMNMSVAALFVLYVAIVGMPVDEIAQHLILGGVVFCVLFVVAMIGPIGGGDIYFTTVIALWIGSPIQFAEMLVACTMLFGAMVVLVMMLRATPLALYLSALPLPRWLDNALNPANSLLRARMPLGVPLGASALLWAWQ